MEYNEKYYNTNHGYNIYHIRATHGGKSTAQYQHYEHAFFIVYFVHGTGNLKVEGKQYDIEEGDIIMVNPHELFQLNVDDDKFHERISIHPSETMLKYFPCNNNSIFMSFYKRKKGEGNRIPAKIVKEHQLDKDLMNLLNIVKSTDSTSIILTICKLIEFLIKLSRAVLPSYPDDNEHVHENLLINDVLKYIRENLTKNISIDSIANEFCVGKSYLSHLFKTQVGISLWNYVIIRRIYMFNYLIKDNDSIEKTCYKVGFQNYSNFFRLYKKHMNMTPAEFKKQLATNKATAPMI